MTNRFISSGFSLVLLNWGNWAAITRGCFSASWHCEVWRLESLQGCFSASCFGICSQRWVCSEFKRWLQGCFSASCFCTSALVRLASVWKKQTVHPIHFPLTGWIPLSIIQHISMNAVCVSLICKAVWVYNNQTIRQQPEFTLIRLSDDSELFMNVFLNLCTNTSRYK